MSACAVITCNAKRKDPETIAQGVTFHQFPVDEEAREKWVDMTGRCNWSPNKKSSICSKHFRENDYIVPRSGKKYLKKTAIPCEYVVYRDLYPDEVPSSDLAEAPAPAQVEDDAFPEPYVDLNDLNDNTIGWDQFQPDVDLMPPLHEIKRIMSKRKRCSKKALAADEDDMPSGAKKIKLEAEHSDMDELQKADLTIRNQSNAL